MLYICYTLGVCDNLMARHMPNTHLTSFMARALAEAETAYAAGEVPVGAVVVHDGKVLAAAGNRVVGDADPTAHAEILVLRQAAQALNSPLLVGCDLWVTLEPCAMCAMAISLARIKRLYIAAEDAKSGGVLHGAKVFTHRQTHHKPEVYDGIEAAAAKALLQRFFADRRDDKG